MWPTLELDRPRYMETSPINFPMIVMGANEMRLMFICVGVALAPTCEAVRSFGRGFATELCFGQESVIMTHNVSQLVTFPSNAPKLRLEHIRHAVFARVLREFWQLRVGQTPPSRSPQWIEL